jgi:hypothetical protein
MGPAVVVDLSGRGFCPGGRGRIVWTDSPTAAGGARNAAGRRARRRRTAHGRRGDLGPICGGEGRWGRRPGGTGGSARRDAVRSGAGTVRRRHERAGETYADRMAAGTPSTQVPDRPTFAAGPVTGLTGAGVGAPGVPVSAAGRASSVGTTHGVRRHRPPAPPAPARRTLLWWGVTATSIVAIGLAVVLVFLLSGRMGDGRGLLSHDEAGPPDTRPPLAKLCPRAHGRGRRADQAVARAEGQAHHRRAGRHLLPGVRRSVADVAVPVDRRHASGAVQDRAVLPDRGLRRGLLRVDPLRGGCRRRSTTASCSTWSAPAGRWPRTCAPSTTRSPIRWTCCATSAPRSAAGRRG